MANIILILRIIAALKWISTSPVWRCNKCIENNRKWLHITCEFIKIGTFNPIKTHIATSFFNVLLKALKMKTNWLWWKFFFFCGDANQKTCFVFFRRKSVPWKVTILWSTIFLFHSFNQNYLSDDFVLNYSASDLNQSIILKLEL